MAAFLVAGPSSARAWGGSSGGSSRSGSSGGSYGGGSSPSAPSNPGSCPAPSLAPLSVSFNTSQCFTCHGQATVASSQRPALPACTDPNGICVQIGNQHHVPQFLSKLGCTACHTPVPPSMTDPGGVTINVNCVSCHSSTGSISTSGVSLPGHSVDTHRIVRDACGQCHHDPVSVIHAAVAGGGSAWSGGSRGGSWGGSGFNANPAGQVAACFFCHVGRASVVAAGIANGCAACSSCHNRNNH